MTESIPNKPFIMAFSIVTLIQSVIWSILSLLAILVYLDAIKINFDSFDIDLEGFSTYFIYMYFYGQNDIHFFSPKKVFIFMWFYFILSIFWIFSSSTEIIFLWKEKKEKLMRISSIVLTTLTFCICVLDLIMVIFVGIDYNKIINHELPVQLDFSIALFASGVMLTLAARGFTLWIVNFSMSTYMTIFIKNEMDSKFKRTSSPTPNFNRAYDDFEDSYIEDVPQPTSWLAKLNAERYGVMNKDYILPRNNFSETSSVYSGVRMKPTFQEPPVQSYDNPRLPGNQHNVNDYGQHMGPVAGDRLEFGGGGYARPVPPMKPALRKNQYGPVVH